MTTKKGSTILIRNVSCGLSLTVDLIGQRRLPYNIKEAKFKIRAI